VASLNLAVASLKVSKTAQVCHRLIPYDGYMTKTAIDQKWKALADQYRASAGDLPEGAEREKLLRKARQLETASQVDVWLSSPGLKAPE
jgi:hypothetical protein